MSQTKISPKIGLVLGSGASRGWSHIGIIKALLGEGIKPDIVCGTSVGAMIGGCYLAGNLVALENWVLTSTRADVLRFFNVRLTRSGFVDKDRFSGFLYQYVAARDVLIENLPRPFAAISTNLENGREVWFQQGGLADAIRASMALPGLFPSITNSINIVQDRITRSRLAGDPAEVVISPRLAHIGLLEFHRAAEAIEEGEICVQNALQEIRKATAEI